VRPEDILLSAAQPVVGGDNLLTGEVAEATDQGATICVRVNVPPDFVCLVTRRAFEGLDVPPGAQVWLSFKPYVFHVF
jgi:ABC-type molybdate transport system ATPase subunit